MNISVNSKHFLHTIVTSDSHDIHEIRREQNRGNSYFGFPDIFRVEAINDISFLGSLTVADKLKQKQGIGTTCTMTDLARKLKEVTKSG